MPSYDFGKSDMFYEGSISDFYKDEIVFYFVRKYLSSVGHDFQSGYPIKYVIPLKDFDDYMRWEFEAFELLYSSHTVLASLAKPK